MTYEERSAFACKVCGNVPDEYGVIEHGRGCYTQSEDGGGTSFVEEAAPRGEITRTLAAAPEADYDPDPNRPYWDAVNARLAGLEGRVKAVVDELRGLRLGGVSMAPPTGTVRLPVTADTSTVLGYSVTEADVMWRGLDWSDVRADHGLFFLPEPETVLNPAWTHPEDKPHLPDGVRYRVRCRHEIGQRLHVGGRYAYVVSVEAEEREGIGWEWIVKYGAREEKGR